MRTLLLVSTSILLTPIARAAEIRAMTLTEALSYAREHQPSLLAARARIDAAQAAAQVPRAQWLPALAGTAQAIVGSTNNSTASYAGAPGVDLVRIGGTKADSPSATPAMSTLVGVGLHQEVYDFGRVAALQAAADALTRVEQQQTGVVQLDIALAVTNGFWAVQAAHAVLSAAQDAVTRAQVNLDEATAGVRQGLRRPIDQTRADADLAHFQVGLAQAQGALDTAETVFAAIVGVPDAALDTDGGVVTPTPLMPLDQALKTAYEHDPDLLLAQSRLEAQQANTSAVAARLKPDLLLTASANGRAGGATPSGETSGPTGAGFLPYIANYDVGLIFSWPLVDFGVKRQVETERANEVVWNEEVATARLQVTSAVEQAHVAARVADATIVQLQRSFDAAAANARQAEALFKAGLSNTLELADAEYLRADAEIQLAIGRFQQLTARARLARAVGEGL